MKTDRLIKLLGVGANLSVLAGLVFVGLEVRTNSAAAQAQIADGIAQGYLELNMAAVADPTVACLWSVGLEHPERLSDVDAARFSWFMRGTFNQYMRVHTLYTTGRVSEEMWAGPAATAAWLMATAGGQLFFPSNPVPQEFLDAIKPYEGSYPPLDFLLQRPVPAACS